MATRILEFGAAVGNDDLPVIPQLITAQTALTASGSSAQSAAFAEGTVMICIDSDEAVYVAIGANPTATTNHYRVKAGTERFFLAQAGQKVAIRT